MPGDRPSREAVPMPFVRLVLGLAVLVAVAVVAGAAPAPRAPHVYADEPVVILVTSTLDAPTAACPLYRSM